MTSVQLGGNVPPIGGTSFLARWGRLNEGGRPSKATRSGGSACAGKGQHYIVPAIASTGAANWRHSMWCWQRPARCTVPTKASTACGAGRSPGTIPGGAARPCRGLAGTPKDIPRSRAVDRLHCSRPAGRRMRALRDFNVAIWGNVSMSGAAYVSWAPCGTACLAVGVSVPPSRPCPLIPRLLVRKLGFWRPALPAPRVPCPDPRCPGTVQEPRASSRHGRPRNGLGHAPTRKSAEPAASVACLQ